MSNIVTADVLAFLLLVVASTLAGWGLVLQGTRCGLPPERCTLFALAIGVAPFLAGIASLIALALFPAWEHITHVIFAFGLLVFATAAAFFSRPSVKLAKCAADWTFGSLVSTFLILFLILVAILYIVYVPLIANDPLEYATVVRHLLTVRDLAAYPMLDGTAAASGFVGPWTHPPMYIAISYVVSAMQISDGSPGLMRLVSPWFWLSSAVVVYALGKRAGSLVGWLAVALYLSTLLLATGTASGQIDSLVAAGLALSALVAAVILPASRHYGLCLGIACGLTLWTHSLGILVLPLALGLVVLVQGIAHPRRWGLDAAVLICTAVSIGSWWYLGNLVRIGSLVSDANPVFRLESLGWGNYFAYTRTHTTLVGKLEYGLFRGWSEIMNYGITYWLFLVGLLAIWKSNLSSKFLVLVLDGIGTANASDRALLTPLFLFLGFFFGTVLTLLLGIGELIRNPRYMLLMSPVIAVIGAYGIATLLHWLIAVILKPNHLQPAREFAAVILVIGVLLVGSFTVISTALSHFQSHVKSAISYLNGEHETLHDSIHESNPYSAATIWMSQNIPEGALILSLRPSDMFYSSRKMVSYLDRRLLQFYAAEHATMGLLELERLGITHVHVPDYQLPPQYNSYLETILGDASLSKLQFNDSGVQIYALERSEEAPRWEQVSPPTQSMERRTHFWFVGFDVRRFFGEVEEYLFGAQSVNSTPHGLGSRLQSVTIRTPDPIPIPSPGEYAVSATLSGSGLIRISVWLLAGREIIDTFRLIEKPLFGSDEEPVNWTRRFLIDQDAEAVVISVEQVGPSDIHLNELSLLGIR